MASVETSEETVWLTAEEQHAWRGVVGLLSRLAPALDAQLRRDAGITHFDYTVLSAVSETPKHTIRMSDLAVLAEGSLPRLSQVVTRLEKRGWVARRPDPDDGRYTLVDLTEAGWETVVATAPGHVREVRRLVIDPLTRTQVRQLDTISHRILAAVDPDGHYE